MKKFIFIIIYFFIIIPFRLEARDPGDSLKYRNAYEYILNSDEIKQYYKESYGMDTLLINVSPQIIKGQVLYFLDELSEYDLSEYSKEKKDSILGLWKKDYYNQDPVIKIDKNLSSFNHNSEFKLLLFFSEIEGNRLYADLEVFEYYEDYNKIIRANQGSSIKLLFYFDSSSSIEKVLTKYLAR